MRRLTPYPAMTPVAVESLHFDYRSAYTGARALVYFPEYAQSGMNGVDERPAYIADDEAAYGPFQEEVHDLLRASERRADLIASCNGLAKSMIESSQRGTPVEVNVSELELLGHALYGLGTIGVNRASRHLHGGSGLAVEDRIRPLGEIGRVQSYAFGLFRELTPIADEKDPIAWPQWKLER